MRDISALTLPVVVHDCISVWHLFVIRCNKRTELQNYLLQYDVHALQHYPISPHKQAAYIEMKDLSLPISEQIHRTVLSLPISPHLSLQDAQSVVDIIHAGERDEII